MPACFFDVSTLRVETPRLQNPSARVEALMGVAGIAEAAALGLPAHAPLVMTGPSVTEDDIALIGGAVQRDVRPPHVPVAVRAPWELSRVAPALGVTLWGPEL